MLTKDEARRIAVKIKLHLRIPARSRMPPSGRLRNDCAPFFFKDKLPRRQRPRTL
jgi:hypothetical protein